MKYTYRQKLIAKSKSGIWRNQTLRINIEIDEEDNPFFLSDN